jgi:hypothetical protein
VLVRSGAARSPPPRALSATPHETQAHSEVRYLKVGTNTQPTPTDRTNTEPLSSLGLCLAAVATEGPAGPRRAPNRRHANAQRAPRRRRRCGAKQLCGFRRPPQPSKDSENSGAQGACSGTRSTGSEANANGYRGNVAERRLNSNRQSDRRRGMQATKQSDEGGMPETTTPAMPSSADLQTLCTEDITCQTRRPASPGRILCARHGDRHHPVT